MMKNFRSEGRFKKEVLRIIVNVLNESDIKNLKKVFRSIDTEKTGKISISELRNAM